MNKPVLYIILFFSFFGKAQNLVPNPSFENIVSCPTGDSQIYLAEPWFQPVFVCGWGSGVDECSSSDLFNSCFIPNPPNWNMGVPTNEPGYQVAHSGNGYAGIAVWQDYGGRERIEIKLVDSLRKDFSYCIKMYVSNTLLESNGGNLTSTSNLQFKFTSDSLLDNQQFGQVYYTPSLSNNEDSVISDTTNWTAISGCYAAMGGEQFLTIGNFYNNSNSIVVDPNAIAAYYYIDDVSVELSNGLNCMCADNNDSIPKEQTFNYPNVFTPNGDGLNDIWSPGDLASDDIIIILNRWGNEVFRLDENHNYWDGTHLEKNVSEGVYYYKAFIKSELKTGFIHLVR